VAVAAAAEEKEQKRRPCICKRRQLRRWRRRSSRGGGGGVTVQEDVHAPGVAGADLYRAVRREAKVARRPEGNPPQLAHGVRFLCSGLSPGSEALREAAKPLPQPWIWRRGGLPNASDLPARPPTAPSCLYLDPLYSCQRARAGAGADRGNQKRA
jgi:hypothetical protein